METSKLNKKILPYSKLLFLIFLSIILFGCKDKKVLKLEDLIGKWITSENDFIEIRNTTNKYDNSNYLVVKGVGNSRGKAVFLYGDTLSFQNRYYSSETNNEELYIDSFNFKVVSITDSFLILNPICENSLTSFEERQNIKFTKQNYAKFDSITFDKIIFHTTYCYGHCPEYHLEVDKSGNTRLFREMVYKKVDKRNIRPDTSKIGYYEGVISDELLNGLKTELNTCNLNTLEFDGATCCDGTIRTIIIYYNNQRKYLKSMFPPQISKDLINHLYKICEEANLKRTDDEFIIEK